MVAGNEVRSGRGGELQVKKRMPTFLVKSCVSGWGYFAATLTAIGLYVNRTHVSRLLLPPGMNLRENWALPALAMQSFFLMRLLWKNQAQEKIWLSVDSEDSLSRTRKSTSVKQHGKKQTVAVEHTTGMCSM
ncbi:unnamed protein product, partial [Amoebophrya sp. A25]|eukprot:GSA25T00013546001.1